MTSAGPGVNVGMGRNIANMVGSGSSTTQSGGSVLSNLFKNKGKLLSGIGLGLGSQLIKSPDVPELPQGVLDYQNMDVHLNRSLKKKNKRLSDN